MECLQLDEYIRKTASVKRTKDLFHELESCINSKSDLNSLQCERIIRACDHQLGESPGLEHIGALVTLIELSLHGYDISTQHQDIPLSMGKIVFHILQNLRSLKVYTLCRHIAELLYSRLSKAKQDKDYCALVTNCFSLCDGLSATKDQAILKPQDKLVCQMQALSFLFLLDTENATPPLSKAVVYTEDVVTEFESNYGVMTEEYATILLQGINTIFKTCWTGDQDSLKQRAASRFYVLFEMVLIIVKLLCKAGFHSQASTFLSDIEKKASDHFSCQCTAVVLAGWGVEVHSTMKTGDKSQQALNKCAVAMKVVSDDLTERECHALLEGFSFVVWAVESGYDKDKGLSGPVLLALISFFEQHQKFIIKTLEKKLSCQAECSRLQKSLGFSIYKGFEFAYESMLACLEDVDTLGEVLCYCQTTAGLMMKELCKQSSENPEKIIRAVIAMSNLAGALYERGRYDKALILVNIFTSVGTASLSVDSQPGLYRRALDWVILWLKALGNKITSRMNENVSLSVKTKTDAARNLEQDHGLSPDVPIETGMLHLLEEDFNAYKREPRGTGKERYNRLCLLLDICHEKSSHRHLRAVFLCEMAKVVCFQDFNEQTDCSEVDFIHEALRLLDEEIKTTVNADKLKDDRANALLWLCICTLEKNLQTPTKSDRKRKELREQTQDSIRVYEGLHFNLAAEHKLCQHLESALDIFQSKTQLSVSEPKETYCSIGVTAALFRLMGKPLQALKAYQVLTDLSRKWDNENYASSLIHSASILLDLGSTELAQVQLDQVQSVLSSNTVEGSSSLPLLAILLKAQCHYNNGQIENGLDCLTKVLTELKKQQEQSISWDLLRARTLQTCSAFLSLGAALRPEQRSVIMEQGISTSDGALCESLNLLCSPLVPWVGKGLYGTPTSSNSSTNVACINQGDNLVLKWQLLAELLNCSKKMVSVRSNCGAIDDARRRCLEALKLAIKLQTLSQCSELLVMKAELELMQGENDKSRSDLDIARNLLERSIDFSDQGLKGAEGGLPQCLLSSLPHKPDCQRPCCSEPCLGRATARWAAAQADLQPQQDPSNITSHCDTVATRLKENLDKLFPHSTGKHTSKPSLMQDIVGRVYLHMALSAVGQRLTNNNWKILEDGLGFVDSIPSPVLRPVRAGLMTAKAIATLFSLAPKNTRTPEKLFVKSPKLQQQTNLAASVLPVTADPTKEATKKRSVKPKIQVTSSSTQQKNQVPTTPVTVEFSHESDSGRHADSSPDNLTLEDVQSFLRSAWLTLQHCPPPTIYPTLCALLALATGQQDPRTTAMLHSHSVGITSRHHTIRHIASCLEKLKKASAELDDRHSVTEQPQTVYEERLTQMNNIFSFQIADPFTSPENPGQEFIQQIQYLPPGVAVCVMSVMEVKLGEMGNSIMLTHLEKSIDPVTVYIDTSTQEHPISQLVQEMDAILDLCVSKGLYSAPNYQVKQLLKNMEKLLGCWKTFLLPLSLDPELSKQTQKLHKILSANEVAVQEEMLKVQLSGSPVLSEDDLKEFVVQVFPQWNCDRNQLLHFSPSKSFALAESRNHVVLILDKYLQKLPWESIPVLKSRSVSRMPSLQSLLGLGIQKETDSESILRRGVDAKKVFYVLNPGNNLEDTQKCFKDWFESEADWEGVCGTAPDSGRLEQAVATKDVYIYIGHEAGEQFLDSEAVLKCSLRAACLLFGCSSGALDVWGQQEGNGIVLSYITAGCPFILGNLWDVRDDDSNRFIEALLKSWFSAGSGASLLSFMESSRKATHWKYLTGAAPVVYGLPVHLT